MLRLLGVLLGNWDFFASVVVMVGHWERRGWFRGGGEAERVAANTAGGRVRGVARTWVSLPVWGVSLGTH